MLDAAIQSDCRLSATAAEYTLGFATLVPSAKNRLIWLFLCRFCTEAAIIVGK